MYPLDKRRVPIAPPLQIPKGSGRLKDLTVPVSDLFNLKGFEVAGYETNQLRVEALMGACMQNVTPLAVVDSITDIRNPILVDAESVIVEVSNRRESYWSNTYLWFVLVFLFSDAMVLGLRPSGA